MLYVYVGKFMSNECPKTYIKDSDAAFNSLYKKDWLDFWAEYLIKNIDKSDLLSNGFISSPYLGTISVEDISGTAKTLIMMKNIHGVVYNGDCIGDNGWEALLVLSKHYDIAMSLSYCPNIERWPNNSIVTFLNDSSKIYSAKEFLIKLLGFDNDSGEFHDFYSVIWPIKLVNPYPDIDF